MERGLDKTVDEVMQVPDVKGVMFTDQRGLCLGVKGLGSKFSPGGVNCLANVAARLDPDTKPPQMILLEAPHRQCLVQQLGDITGVICKQTPTSPTSAHA